MKSKFISAAANFGRIFFIFSFLFISAATKSQVIKTEGFENTASAVATFPNSEFPFGWTEGRIAPSYDANNRWDRVDAANSVFPAAGIHGGTKQIRFRSYYMVNAVNNPEKGYLCSRPYDLSNRVATIGTAASNVSFWLYRDNTYAYNDQVTVQVNNSPTVAGASAILNEVTTFSAVGIPRNCTQAPATPGPGWYQYTFQIPGGAAYSTNTLYVLITVTHTGGGAGGGNVYIDDFSINTYPSAQTFNNLGMDLQMVAPVAKPSTNNPIIEIHVTANNEASQCALGAFVFTHNGTTNPGTDIAFSGSGGVKLWWTGGTNSFSFTNAIQVGSYAGSAFPVANFSITPSIPAPYNGLLNDINYFWLTYDIASGGVAGDIVDADFISASVCASVHICGSSGCSLAGGRPIDIAYCIPVYTVGTSAPNGAYTNGDYIRHVIMAGDPIYPPGIYNDHNDVGPNVAGSGANDPCVPAGGCNGGPCPFAVHPADYEKFSTTSVPNLCSAGSSSRTAVLLADGTASYSISVQCGTWYGSNCIAAWIDFNHDGVFNNTLVPAAGGEKLFQSGYMNALTWVTNPSFQVPDGATTGYFGTTTMRVREIYANSAMDACSQAYYGETEDYTVTLRPGCSPLYPGWKIWLGYTDDWNISANWCGGIPTLNDNALIPGHGSQSFNRAPGTYHPVIKSGVSAETRKLVMLNDTLEINAPLPGPNGLRVSDSLSIGVAGAVNTSALIVNSSHIDSAQLSKGVSILLGNNLLFRGGQREKVQLMYKSAELTAKGMIDGDLIDSIYIPIRQRNSTNPWKNFNISYYYAANGAYYSTVTGYTGVSNNTSVAPLNGAYPNNASVYANANLLLSGAPWNIPAAGGWLKIPLSTPIQVNVSAGVPLIVTICFDQMGAANATPLGDYTWQTQTTGYRSMMQLYQLGTGVPPAPAGCSMVDTTGKFGGAGFVASASDFRPNVTFKYHRVYQQFPINMATNGATTSNWTNYGDFHPGNSTVIFDGTATTMQNIGGPNSTSYHDLTINNFAGVKLYKPVKVNDVLNLQNGKLILNSRSVSVLNPDAGAIIRTAGTIQSETMPPANYGTIEWTIDTTTGAHVFPFATSAGDYIPFNYYLTSGDVGIVKVATYHTAANNLPYPTGVTNVNDTNNVNNSAYTIDRFWHLEKTGSSGNVRIKFTYLNSEAPAPIINGNVRAQNYNSSNNKWRILTYSMTNTVNSPSPSTSQVLVTGVTGSNLNATIWALADASSPLRLENSIVHEMEVTPNPFTDKISISLNFSSDAAENISLSLYNMLGEKVGGTIIPAYSISNEERIEWVPENIKNGIYFLVIQTMNEIRTERIVKMGE